MPARSRHSVVYEVVTGSPKKERKRENTPYSTSANATPSTKK